MTTEREKSGARTVVRRDVLTALAVSIGFAGCNTDGAREVRNELTPAPMPTDRPTPAELPPPDLSSMDVENSRELGRRHQHALVGAPHGFHRHIVVEEKGDTIRTVDIVVRSSAESERYYRSVATEETSWYPGNQRHSLVETWYDGTLYQRFDEGEDHRVSDIARPFSGGGNYMPQRGTTDQDRIVLLFAAFSTVDVSSTGDTFDVSGRDLRAGLPVVPEKLPELSDPRNGRFRATVTTEPLAVSRYEMSMNANLSQRAVSIEETNRFERLSRSPQEPEWVAAIRTIDE